MKPLVVACVVALMLLTASSARADYFISKPRAETFMRAEVRARYGESDGILGVSCRPQWARSARRGFVYHRWACAWVDDSAWGRMIIAGSSRGRDWYHALVVKGLTPISF